MKKSLSHALLLCALLPVFLFAQADTSFFFVQLTDPQFGMYPTGRNFRHERENVRAAIQAINRVKPDFVVVTGDLVNKEGNPKQMAAFKEEFGRLDSTIRFVVVPGNHDVGNTPTDSSLARYRRDFGPDYYEFDRHGVRFIVLNSSLIKAPSKAPKEARLQEDWLRKLLTSDVLRLTVVFLHHPPFIESPSEVNSYENLPQKTRREYLALFEKLGVTHIFAGHLHRNASAHTGSIEVVASGPIGMPLGTDSPGLMVVEVRKEGIRHKYYGINEFGRIGQQQEQN